MSVNPSRPCGICGRIRPVMRAKSAWGPFHYDNCSECLLKPAEPIRVFEHVYNQTVAKSRNADLRMKIWYTWKDGQYINWLTYLHQKNQERMNVSQSQAS